MNGGNNLYLGIFDSSNKQQQLVGVGAGDVPVINEDNTENFQRLVSRYGQDDIPLVALILLVTVFSVQVASKALVISLSEADANSKKANSVNNLLAQVNKLKARQGTAKPGDNIPASPELTALKADLTAGGYDGNSIVTWADLDAVSTQIKADADSYSNLSSQLQLRIQQNNNRLNTVSDMGSNLMNKLYQTLNTPVANMR